MNATTNLEFDVQMTCGNCVQAIEKAFVDVKGVNSLKIDLANGQVLVNGSLGAEAVKSIIESTGRKAVLKGIGGLQGLTHQGAAVAMMEFGNQSVRGLVRLVQISQNELVVDGTVDGLTPGKHALCVHECGDVTHGCNSCGDVYGYDTENKTAVGEMGDIEARADGRAEFRFVNDKMKVWDMIGRSMMIHDCASDIAHRYQNRDERISCGIIARSAGLFQNSKKFCSCDGVTQWDERDKPVAGHGRQANL